MNNYLYSIAGRVARRAEPRDRLSSFFIYCCEQPTPSALQPCSPLRDPNLGQNDKERRQPFHSPILPLIFGTDKPLIGQGRKTVSKLLSSGTPANWTNRSKLSGRSIFRCPGSHPAVAVKRPRTERIKRQLDRVRAACLPADYP